MNPYTKTAKALDAATSPAKPASTAPVTRASGEKNRMQQSIDRMSPSDVDNQNRRATEFSNRNKARMDGRKPAERSSGRGR